VTNFAFADHPVANTLALTCEAANLVRVSSVDDARRASEAAGNQGIPLLVLGDGSNLVLPPRLNAMVLQVADESIEIVEEGAHDVLLRVGAGKNWHELVETCLKRGWFGLENLALIPGRVGAAPVQNIGAYGRELDAFVVAVHGYDCADDAERSLDAEACEFAYRESIFKNHLRDRFVILAVDFRLSKSPQLHCEYPALRARMDSGAYPETPEGVFRAVVDQRRQRLPDPARQPNVGSFFKNPLVDAELATELQERYSDLPCFPQSDARVKLSAAWLIDRCGLRGESLGGAMVSEQHALVLENRANATQADVLALAKRIKECVLDTFSVELQEEPRIL